MDELKRLAAKRIVTLRLKLASAKTEAEKDQLKKRLKNAESVREYYEKFSAEMG